MFLLEKAIGDQQQQIQYKKSFIEMKDKIQGLSLDIEFMQAVQEQLILPFTVNPSLKTLGHSLTQLTFKTMPMAHVQSIELYYNSQLISEDIRQLVFVQNGPVLTNFEQSSPVYS